MGILNIINYIHLVQDHVWNIITSVKNGKSTKPVTIKSCSRSNRDDGIIYTVKCEDGCNYVLNGDALLAVEGGAEVLHQYQHLQLLKKRD